MANKFGLNDASRIIDVIDQRIAKATRSGAGIEYTWGKVATVASDGRTAGAYLYGETDSAYVSDGFVLPETTYVSVGDAVKVAMDYSTGQRWIEEVYVSSAYRKLVLDVQSGIISFGDGSADTDTDLSRVGSGVLATTRLRLTAIDDVSLSSTAHPLQIGPDSSANLALDANEIHARNNGAASELNLNADGGKVQINISSSPTTSDDGLGFGSDVNLYRSAANVLKTDDSLAVGGSITVGTGTYPAANMSQLTGGTLELRSANPFIDFSLTTEDYGARIIYDLSDNDYLQFTGAARYTFDNDITVSGGDIYIGTGGLQLYATGNGVGLVNAGTAKPLKAGGILVSNSYSDPDPNTKGIQFGADANLYWNASNELKTDDSLVVAGKLTAGSLGAWVTTGFTNATGFSVTTGKYRVLLAGLVEVHVIATYSGATLTGNARGNIADTPVCTFPTACRPSEMLPVNIEGSISFFGGTLSSGGVLSMNEINGSGAYIESGEVVRYHGIFSTDMS